MSAGGGRYGTSDGYPPLPPGRHLLPREYVDQYQRRRLVVALAELAHEEGLAAVTVTALTGRARISRKTFYDYFADRDECLDYAGEEATTYLFTSLEDLGPGDSPDARIAAGVEALLDAVTAEPNLAELALVHAPALGGERGQRFQKTAIEAIADLVGESEGADGTRTRGAETIASAIIGVIASQLHRGAAEQVRELADEVVRLAELPTIGVDRLRKEDPH